MAFSENMQRKLKTVLAELNIGLRDWQFLSKGDHYDVYFADFQRKTYILRVKQHQVDNDIIAEHNLWNALSLVGIAPALLYFDPDFSLSLYGGRPINQFSSYKMAHFMARFHSQNLGSQGVCQIDWQQSYPCYWQKITQSKLPLGLCHSDLLPGNILVTKKYYQLIDFQFSHYALPIIDLAVLCLYWPRVKAKRLLKSYFQARKISFSAAEKSAFLSACKMLYQCFRDYILTHDCRFGLAHVKKAKKRLRSIIKAFSEDTERP